MGFISTPKLAELASNTKEVSKIDVEKDKHVIPWRIEDELKRIGANYVQAGPWRGFAIRDGKLITGQQKFSGEETARLLLDTLGR